MLILSFLLIGYAQVVLLLDFKSSEKGPQAKSPAILKWIAGDLLQ